MKSHFDPIWSVQASLSKAPLPEWMSFHFFNDARRCPRAVVLQRSAYPNLWIGTGYPRRANISALAGRVIHSTVETIVDAFARHGVESMDDPKTMECLGRLGGYLAILSQEVDRTLTAEESNPRQKKTLPALKKMLKLQLPQMRQSVQQMLVSRDWDLSGKRRYSGTTPAEHATTDRKPLSLGVHFEIELQDPSLSWKGRLDVITVATDGCSIVDLKTGKDSEEHQEQIRIYGLLWDGDIQLNPSRIPLKSLTLSYGARQVPVTIHSPSSEARSLLQTQTLQVRQELASNPAPAHPSSDNCRFCQVKLLCNECSFWKEPVLDQPSTFGDVELLLAEPKNDVTWAAHWNLGGKVSSAVLLKKSLSEESLWEALQPGFRLRLSGAVISLRDEGEAPLISFTAFTEALLIG